MDEQVASKEPSCNSNTCDNVSTNSPVKDETEERREEGEIQSNQTTEDGKEKIENKAEERREEGELQTNQTAGKLEEGEAQMEEGEEEGEVEIENNNSRQTREEGETQTKNSVEKNNKKAKAQAESKEPKKETPKTEPKGNSKGTKQSEAEEKQKRELIRKHKQQTREKLEKYPQTRLLKILAVAKIGARGNKNEMIEQLLEHHQRVIEWDKQANKVAKKSPKIEQKGKITPGGSSGSERKAKGKKEEVVASWNQIVTENSQYGSGSISGCGVYAFESVLQLLNSEAAPSKELLEKIIGNQKLTYNSEFHLDPFDIYHLPRFANHLHLRESCQFQRDSNFRFGKLFKITLAKIEKDSAKRIGFILVCPPEIISIVVEGQNSFVCFDSHAKNGHGASFTILPSLQLLQSFLNQRFPLAKQRKDFPSCSNLGALFTLFLKEQFDETKLEDLDFTQIELRHLKSEISVLKERLKQVNEQLSISEQSRTLQVESIQELQKENHQLHQALISSNQELKKLRLAATNSKPNQKLITEEQHRQIAGEKDKQIANLTRKLKTSQEILTALTS